MKAIFLTFLLVVAVLSVLFVNSQAATTYEKDFVKAPTERYGTITISDDKAQEIIEYKLLDNSDYCFTNCYAEGIVTIGTPTKLFKDVSFIDLDTERSTEINDYKFYYSDSTKIVEYEEVAYEESDCKEIVDANGTVYPSCTITETRIPRTREERIWKDANGIVLNAGTYYWRIEGQKSVGEDIDWVATTDIGNYKLTEWAFWKDSFNTNLTAYWNFSKEVNLTDIYLGKHNLSNNGNVVNVNNGKIGEAFIYDGNGDRCNTSSTDFVIASQEFTINLWANKTSATTEQFMGALDGSNNGYALYTENPTNKLSFYAQNGAYNLVDPEVFAQNKWIMVTITRNVTGTYLYKNATLVASSISGLTAINSGGAQIYIGAYSTTNSFTGTIDEVSFWNRAFSISEINDLYNSGDGLSYSLLSFAVTLNTQDNKGFNSTSALVNCSATSSGASLVNITLYTNNSGTFTADETRSFTGSSNSSEFTVNVATDKEVLWNCYVCNTNTCIFADNNRTIYRDTTPPALTIISPTSTMNSLGYIGKPELLNWSIVELHSGFIFFNHNGTNSSIYGLSNSTTFLINKTNPESLVFWVNDSVGNVNSTIVVWNYSIFQNNFTYNVSTYETATEKFFINLSANSSLTAVNLFYNGVSYPATKSGDTWTKTMDVETTTARVNRSFYWNFTFGGMGISSIKYNQTIDPIYFTLCNTTYNKTYINFSAKDESTLAAIPNMTIPYSSFIYFVGSGNINKTYTFINNTATASYGFCYSHPNNTINTIISLQYKNQESTYPQRVYESGRISLTNNTQNVVLYLLSSTAGQYVTLQVINLAEQPIAGVIVNGKRELDGTMTSVAYGTTDASGAVTFWLDPNYVHTFNFSKSGYTDFITSFAPTQTSYTITLGTEESGTITEDYSKGISYTIYPNGENSTLLNDTTYLFKFVISSEYWDISEFGFSLYNSTGDYLDSISLATNGGTASVSYNTGSNRYIIMKYYYVIEGNYTNGTMTWNIQNSAGTDWSIKTFFEDFLTYTNDGIFGLDGFGRAILVFLIIFIFVGVMSYKFGMTSPAGVSALIFGLVMFFDVGVGLVPNPVNAVTHFPTIFMGIIMLGVLFREVYQ